MSDQLVSFTESPASWNTKYVTADGFECQLTLRAENGQELLERANGAMAYLRKNGCEPFTFAKGRRSNGSKNGSKTQSTESDKQCPIHDVPMRKFEKEGRVWYFHKTDNGWCSGKTQRREKRYEAAA